jgi:hypothetical protein
VILKANGQTIVDSGDLPASIALARPGEKLQLQVWRNGRPEDLTATLQGIQDSDEAVAQAGNADSGNRLGLALRPLQPQERREARVTGPGGLLVEDAERRRRGRRAVGRRGAGHQRPARHQRRADARRAGQVRQVGGAADRARRAAAVRARAAGLIDFQAKWAAGACASSAGSSLGVMGFVPGYWA